MKAIVITKYGHPLQVLQLKEVDKPALSDERVLVRVYATSVNVADLAPVVGHPVARLLGTGLRKPKSDITGTDLAGVVEAVGANVTRFKPGDEVFGAAPATFAEYASAREDRLVLKPANVTFEQAAAVPVAALTALQGLRKGGLQPGQKVLVYGASGGVGTFMLQIAKALGGQVTALCSTANLENARAQGAERVIDYTKEDFTRDHARYDLLMAVNGYRPLGIYRRALSPQGVCVVAGGSLRQVAASLLLGRLLSRRGGKQVIFMGIAKFNLPDLIQLAELLETGQIKPLIEETYPFAEAAQAAAHVHAKHARGKVVIVVDHGPANFG